MKKYICLAIALLVAFGFWLSPTGFTNGLIDGLRCTPVVGSLLDLWFLL